MPAAAPVQRPQPLQFYRTVPFGSGADAQQPPVPVQTSGDARSQAGARRKRFVRRTPDRTQQVRRSVQLAFLLLNVWIGIRFYLFVRYFETGGHSVFVARPPGVEGYLPIAALMNLKYFLLTGHVVDVHPAGLFLLAAFGAVSFFFRKAFCSWLCPIGTLSEWLWQGGREIFGRNFALPRWIDIPVRGLKYVLLGLFLYAVAGMSAAEIRAFLGGPYGLIADVKMLNFFRALGSTGAVVIAFLAVSSLLVKNAWCRYLCPYGALMGVVALFSPARVRRNADACIDCGKCAKVCPSLLPVDRAITIKSAECTGCLECVSVCPARDALDFVVPRRRVLPGWAIGAGIAVLFLGLVGYARLTGHWHTPLSPDIYYRLIPNANSYGHPG